MDMTSARWAATSAYLRDVFAREDEHLRSIMPRALAAGLPDIAVSPESGRMLHTIASMLGPKLIVEVGTLAGYSGIWLARALAPGGRLITIDINPAHSAFARAEFARAGLNVEARTGPALDLLPAIDGPIDIAFLDGVKTEYPEYLRILRPRIRRGGLILADNALGSSWWIDSPPGSDPQRDAVDRFNRAIAADPGLDSSIIPIGNGILIARVR